MPRRTAECSWYWGTRCRIWSKGALRGNAHLRGFVTVAPAEPMRSMYHNAPKHTTSLVTVRLYNVFSKYCYGIPARRPLLLKDCAPGAKNVPNDLLESREGGDGVAPRHVRFLTYLLNIENFHRLRVHVREGVDGKAENRSMESRP